MIKLERIRYKDLTPRQQEIFNFHKISAALADYGFNCIKLSDDWQGADFIAYHKDTDKTLRVQLKSRLTIAKKYIDKQLYIAFPHDNHWYIIMHDDLVEKVKLHTNWLNTNSWECGDYHSKSINQDLLNSLQECKIK